jgi:serine protease Do
MKRILVSFCALFCFVGPVAAQGGFGGGRDPALEFTRSNPKFIAAFKSAIARPSASTVRVLVSGKDTALGVVVGPDGWILTKANDLADPGSSIAVRLRGEAKLHEAELVGLHTPHDLALLKIDVKGLTPIEFKDSKSAEVGSWVVCVGMMEEPAAVGVVSVATRTVVNKGPPVNLSKMAFLGVTLEPVTTGGAKITSLSPNMPASKIGLKVDDVILLLAGNKVADPDGLKKILSRYKPGDTVTLRVRRGDTELEKAAKLDRAPETKSDIQNKMGSELSTRISGYATVLQHDAPLKPSDCGGPLVDLDGRVVGINITRPGRVESWALPSEVIRPILAEMMLGKLAPPKADPLANLSPEEKVANAQVAVKTALLKAERDKSKFEKEIEEARRALQSAEAEFRAYRITDSAESAERILRLMQERLLTMNAVAGWKWNHRQEILDADREFEALARLKRRAKELSVDPKLVERFFRAQMEASRILQQERIADWQSRNEPAIVNENLTKELRPHIDLLNDELLTTLAKVARYWTDAELDVQGRIRQRSTQMVAGQGISPAIRAKALEGLLAP